ncbi:hypothetical protein ACQEU3_38130 [Spirillospora sp. CA-253888]
MPAVLGEQGRHRSRERPPFPGHLQHAPGHRTNMTIRVHETADHLFFAGDGPSTPAGSSTSTRR